MTIETEPGPADRRPAIVICAYDGDGDSWDLVEDLSGQLWSPPGARTVRVEAAEADGLAAVLTDHLRGPDCRAILLVGRTHNSGGFRVQMWAPNRTLDRTARLSPTGPGLARTTAPVADIVRALTQCGLVAEASSDPEADAGSYLLYRVLADLQDGPHTPFIGLLRAPLNADEAAVKKAVKAAATAMTSHLAPLPRAG